MVLTLLSFFPYLNLVFSPFTMPPRRSVVDHSALTTSIESIEYPGNGDIQVSEHEEITIDPVIQATSHRRQTGTMRGAAKPLSEFQYGRIFTYLTLGWAPKTIAKTLGISPHTVWNIERNLLTYGSMRKLQLYPRGRRRWRWRMRMPCFNTCSLSTGGLKRS